MTENKEQLSSTVRPVAFGQVKTANGYLVAFGMVVFLGLFVGIGSWLYFANLAGAVIASGTVVVDGKPKTLQHLDGGIVSKINVRDGDYVEGGDVLIRLDDTLLAANREIFGNRLREAVAKRSRLLAEREEVDTISWDNELLDLLKIGQEQAIMDGHEKLFLARKKSLTGQISQLQEQIAQFGNQRDGIVALSASKNRQIAMLREELANVEALKKKGLVTNDKIMALEREKENMTGQISGHESDVARIENAINEAEIKILQLQRDSQEQVLAELREVEQEINSITPQLQAVTEQLKRIEVRAPVSGVVHEMSVYTIGGVIGPGAAIMQIIPSERNFVVEAMVAPQYIDDLYLKQLANLRFSAFNLRTTPEMEGVVKQISADIVRDQRTQFPFYEVLLEVNPDALARAGNLELVPGMPVEVFIKTEDRSALNYLSKPLFDYFNRALREG